MILTLQEKVNRILNSLESKEKLSHYCMPLLNELFYMPIFFEHTL